MLEDIGMNELCLMQALAKEVANHLGCNLSPIKLKHFADKENYVAIEVSSPFWLSFWSPLPYNFLFTALTQYLISSRL